MDKALYYVVAIPLLSFLFALLYSLIPLAIGLLIFAGFCVRKQRHAEREAARWERIEMCERAVAQNRAALRGELYGTYGRHMPAREILGLADDRQRSHRITPALETEIGCDPR